MNATFANLPRVVNFCLALLMLGGCSADAQQPTNADAKDKQRSSASKLRRWSDAAGKFSVEATFIDAKDRTVRIKKKDGRIVSISIDRLSKADQRYVENQVEQRKPNPTNRTIVQKETTGSGKRTDWPHWRGPNGNGISSETGLIHEFPETGPNILWRKQLGTGFSGLAVSGGRLFTMFGEDGRERVVCFDAKTGREIWKIDSDADFAQGRSFGPRSTPCVDGNHVYAMGASGKLHCLESATGKTVWSFNIYDKFEMRRFFNEEGVSCSPLIDGRKLIVLAGISAFAFDKTNGKVIWQVLKEKMRHSTPTFATFGGQRQLVALTGSNLVGLDPESGREFWRHPQGGACVAPVVGPGNQVFAAASYGAGGQLVKIAGGTATQIYKTNKLSTHHATAMLYKGHLYGFHDRPGIFKCVEFGTGDEKWVSRSPGKGKLIIADEQMIIITEYGALVLAKPSPDGYMETAKARLLKGTCYTAPSLANGKLYVRSDQEMVCIEMKKKRDTQ